MSIAIGITAEKIDSREGAKARRCFAIGEAAQNADVFVKSAVEILKNACGASRPLRAFAPSRESFVGCRIARRDQFTAAVTRTGNPQ